ncbi:MAG: DNA repair protein RecN [Bacteroidaceae bacterium]|nr:DNA repair protein RecN [Bacteroidaceae bacterium]
MLQSLHIQNYALIENLDITFYPGFSVITGETGAGKSIILGALGLILGQRTDVKAIKQGAKRCVVEAVFDLSHFGLESFFENNGLDFDGECIVRREMTDSGKSRAFVNDTPVAAVLLKELSPYLIDIHSQHQNLLINQATFQLNVLDTVADNAELLRAYFNAYHIWKDADRALHDFQERLAREQSEFDFLSFQLHELSDARLQADEQQTLEEESLILENAETIKSELYTADAALSAEDSGTVARLHEALRHLSNLATVFPDTKALHERLDSAIIEIEDIAQEIASLQENFSFDPQRLDAVTDRLNLIYSLQKKYRVNTVSELIEKAQALQQQLDGLENSEETLAQLRQESQRALSAATQAAARLTETRQKAARRVESEMQERLRLLNMPNIRFEVALSAAPQLQESGADQVQFLFSANKNTPLQDLSLIASGGEIARVMLSLKAMLADSTSQSTVIFDEIDTGVSGQTAEQMARMMKAMSHNGRQVISITHLPQIAAHGEHHYKVYKEDHAETTATHIRQLSPDERVTEIAQLLSGTQLTEAALNNARELLANS